MGFDARRGVPTALGAAVGGCLPAAHTGRRGKCKGPGHAVLLPSLADVFKRLPDVRVRLPTRWLGVGHGPDPGAARAKAERGQMPAARRALGAGVSSGRGSTTGFRRFQGVLAVGVGARGRGKSASSVARQSATPPCRAATRGETALGQRTAVLFVRTRGVWCIVGEHDVNN